MVSGGKSPRPFSLALAASTFPLPSETMGRIRLDDGGALQIRSDDEMIPEKQQMPPPVSPPFDVVYPEFVPLRGESRDGYATHVHTPKRSGVDLDAPSTQRARMSSQAAKDLEVLEAGQSGDDELSAQHGITQQNHADTIDLTKDFSPTPCVSLS